METKTRIKVKTPAQALAQKKRWEAGRLQRVVDHINNCIGYSMQTNVPDSHRNPSVWLEPYEPIEEALVLIQKAGWQVHLYMGPGHDLMVHFTPDGVIQDKAVRNLTPMRSMDHVRAHWTAVERRIERDQAKAKKKRKKLVF